MREIAERLTAAGQHGDARPVQEAGDLADDEAFVIGSAAYPTHRLKDATAFVRRNRDLVATTRAPTTWGSRVSRRST